MKKTTQLLRSKWREYLIEIIVIIVGILLAIALNNWNENRKNQIELQSDLKALKNDVLADSIQLELSFIRFKTMDDFSDYMWKFLENELQKIDTTYLIQAFTDAGHVSDFFSNRTAYNELVSSEGFRLLKNTKLKKKMAIYYNTDLWANLNLEQRFRYTQEYFDSRYPHLNPYMLENRLKPLLKIDTSNIIPLTNFKMDWDALKKDVNYKMALSKVISQRIGNLHTLNKSKKRISELLQLLDEELQN